MDTITTDTSTDAFSERAIDQAAADIQEYNASVSAVNWYGIWSVIFATTTPLVYKLVIENLSDFNATGYKVGAYTNLVSWGPYAFVYFFYWLTGGAEIVLGLLDQVLRFGILGPWFFNIYAMFVIGKTGFVDATAMKIGGFAVYFVYSVFTMAVQFTLAPSILELSAIEATPSYNSYRDYEEPRQDEKEAPEMDNEDYKAET